MASALPTGSEPPLRRPRETLFEIAGLSVLFTLASLAPVAACVVTGEDAWSLVIVAGEVVHAHIGWAFGVFIPVLMGFYAIVGGGQLAKAANVGTTRRTLGIVAEMMVASLAPAVAALTLACIAKPVLAGSLLAVIPVAAVTLFLAVQLGGFVVFEKTLLLATAEETRTSTATLMGTLRVRSRRRVWVVFSVHVVSSVLLSVIVLACISLPGLLSMNGMFFLMSGMFSVVHATCCFFAVWASTYSRDRSSTILGWVVGVLLTLMMVLLSALFAIYFGWAAGWAFLGSVIFTSISALWPIARGPRFLADWTIRGGATRYAAKLVASTYARLVRDIVRLKADLKSPSLWQKIKIAVQRFRMEPPAQFTR